MTAPNKAPAIHIQGTLDIVTGNFNNVSVLLGDGSGSFSASTTSIGAGAPAASVAIGDVNGDGKSDIVTANYSSGNVSVLLGDGLGGFTASTTSLGGESGPNSVALGDVNGDGKLDIVTANYDSHNVSVLLGDGSGGFTAGTASLGGGRGFSVALGDVNGDGKLDVVTANLFSSNVSVLLGDGLGGFTASIVSLGGSVLPHSVALGDLNGDGNLDIVTDAGPNHVNVLLGDGLGGFTAGTGSLGGGANALSVALGDLNGDGKLDIVTANLSGEVSVLLGDGLGGFTASTVATGAASDPVSVALADINGDGKLDIVTANQFSNDVSVLLGDGLGGFTASTRSLGGGSNPQSVAIGNLDSLAVIAEDTALVFSAAHHNAITVSDVDGGSGSETVTLSVAHGTLALATLAGLTGVTGNNSGSVTFSGTIADLNTALDGLTYQGVQDYNGADTLNIGINDNGNTGTGGGLTASALQAISVTAVNDAPVNTVPAGPLSTQANQDLAIAGLSVSDVDVGTVMTTTLHVDHGTLTVAAGGVTVTGSGTDTVTLTGLVSAIDAKFATSNAVLYHSAADFVGTDHLTITSNDGGSGLGAGGALSEVDSVAINVTGLFTAGNDTVTLPAAGTYFALAGDDTILLTAANEAAYGGPGNDTYHVDAAGGTIVELANEGTDTVQTATLSAYVLGANVENLTHTGSNDFYGEGNSLDNVLIGGLGNDYLVGGDGNDTLIDGSGLNTLQGGKGDDIYAVQSNDDTVYELPGEGHDQVQTFLTFYHLSANVEDLTFTGSGTINHTGVGNASSNVITGNTGNDTLDGGVGGPDTLIGGLGNDTYIIHNIGDLVIENANAGTDTVQVSSTTLTAYALTANVENLTHIGSNSFYGEGNSLDNVLTGGTGNDYLVGDDGNDTFIDGNGLNTLQGGKGDDIYAVQSNADTVYELPGEGTDQVQTFLTNYTLAANVENLTFTGNGTINHTGTGNDLANVITGNSGNDVLNGLLGNDTLTGGGGADQFVFSTALGANNIDTITDFTVNSDKIVLDHSIFSAAGPTGTLADAAFTSGAETAASRIIYDANTGHLSYDADGSGAAAAIQFATVTAHLSLTAKDFLIV